MLMVVTPPDWGLVQEQSMMDTKKKQKEKWKKTEEEEGNRTKEIEGWSSNANSTVMVVTPPGWVLTQPYTCNPVLIDHGPLIKLVGSPKPSQPVEGHGYYLGRNNTVYDKSLYIGVYDKSSYTSTGE